jgi:hypothetical protein
MKKAKFALTFSVISCAALFLLATRSFAEDVLPLPYDMTFDCPEMTLDTMTDFIPCNHLPGALQGTGGATDGHYSQITSDANFPLGGGGRGFRQWIGEATNDLTTGLDWDFLYGTGGREEKELWIRWYVRWEPGFTWGTSGLYGQKVIYLAKSPSGTDSIYFNWGGDFLRITNGLFIISGNFGTWDFWNLSGKKTFADGSWHCIETHIRTESSLGAGNGFMEWWIDNVLRLNGSNFNTGSAGIPNFAMPSNGNGNANGTTQWMDIDDVSISNTGRSGCPYPYATMGEATAVPQSPTNLQLK